MRVICRRASIEIGIAALLLAANQPLEIDVRAALFGARRGVSSRHGGIIKKWAMRRNEVVCAKRRAMLRSLNDE
jgi:hypothetical protein